MTTETGFTGSINAMQFMGNSSPVNRPSEWKLARMLEAVHMPESQAGKDVIERMLAAEHSALVNKTLTIGRELAAPDIARFEKTRELLQTEAIESTSLIQAQFYSTVLEGAEPNKVIRGRVRSVPMRSNQQTFTLGETGSVLPKVAEGAELPSNQQDYSTVTLTSYKYGEKNLISSELIEDSLYDIMALEVAKGGARAENTLNHVVLTKMLDDAGNEHDCSGSNLGTKALMGALKEMRVDGYNGTVIFGCADAEYQLMADSQISYANYFGTNSAIATGTVPRFLGMEFYRIDPMDTTYDSGTYAWEYNSDSDIGMVVLDAPSMATVIGMRRDITVKDYDDPVRDLRGAALTMRFAVDTPFDNGICRIEY